QFLAEKLGVSRSTIIRWLNYLESKNALVRIPVAGKVCAYALDPHEVWKGYNTTKNHAAFAIQLYGVSPVAPPGMAPAREPPVCRMAATPYPAYKWHRAHH
ncbi:helix-turn-helix domain-containing protein, partial [Klebsiella pneumoniae]